MFFLLFFGTCLLFPSIVEGEGESHRIAVYDFTKRSLSDSETHPELLAFRLELPEDNVILHLQRRDSLNVHRAPVFITGDDGQLKRLERGAPESVPYQSQDKRSAVTVTVKRLSNGRLQRSLMGYFGANGNVYEIKRSEQSESNDKKRGISDDDAAVIHTVTRRGLNFDGGVSLDDVKIYRRNEYRTYYVEMFVIIDFSTYSLFDKDIKRTIEHYSQVVNGIDLVFGSITDPELQVKIRLTGFFVAQTEEDAPWTDSNPDKEPGRKGKGFKIKPGDIKRVAREWLGERAETLPPYDHVQLFTGIPMRTPKPDGTVSGAAGVSGGVCGGRNSPSLVRAAPADVIRTGPAHEVGHSLGAKHDSKYEEECPRKTGSVMGGGPPFTFSKCAIRDMKKKMEKLDRKNENCLLNVGTNMKEYADIIKKLPGQFYDADDQCKMKNGPTSVHCNVNKKRYNCVQLECMDEGGNCEPVKLPPAYGTSCGKNKWCIQGKCVKDRNAP